MLSVLFSTHNLGVEDVPLQHAAYCQLCLSKLLRADRNSPGEQSPAGHASSIAVILGGNPQTCSQVRRSGTLAFGTRGCLNCLTISMEEVESSVQDVFRDDTLWLQRLQAIAPLHEAAMNGDVESGLLALCR